MMYAEKTWSSKRVDSEDFWGARAILSAKTPNPSIRKLNVLRKAVTEISAREERKEERYFLDAQIIRTVPMPSGTSLCRKNVRNAAIHFWSKNTIGEKGIKRPVPTKTVDTERTIDAGYFGSKYLQINVKL